MEDANNTGRTKLTVYVVVVLGTFLLMGFLVRQMVKRTSPPAINAERAAARAKDNGDIRAGGVEQLNNYGYVDQAKGVARLPIEEAMKLTVQGYKNTEEFHSNLVARVEKATAPPPKPPEKPSEYE